MVRDIMTMRLIIRHPLPPNQQLVMLCYAEPVEYGGDRNSKFFDKEKIYMFHQIYGKM
jgi:hypothetical protein